MCKNCISRYFPLWEYWTGRYFPGNTTREIPPCDPGISRTTLICTILKQNDYINIHVAIIMYVIDQSIHPSIEDKMETG